jgi:hypothetical protein
MTLTRLESVERRRDTTDHAHVATPGPVGVAGTIGSTCGRRPLDAAERARYERMLREMLARLGRHHAIKARFEMIPQIVKQWWIGIPEGHCAEGMWIAFGIN